MACHNDGEVIDKILLLNPQSINKLNQIPNKQTRLLKFLIDTPILGTLLYNIQTTKESFKKVFLEEYFEESVNVKEEMLMSYVEASHLPDFNAKFSFASFTGRYMNATVFTFYMVSLRRI